jgi:DNA primase
MRFSDAFLEEIRQRLPIHEVVGEHVIWDKRKSNPGRGDYWACCPFHGEKHPSFHADDRTGRYYCFGCQASGDHFRFLTERTGMSFPEAIEKLAGIAGVPMPARDEKSEAREEARRSLYDVMELATGYFEAALAHNVGARARGYLSERGVSPQSQARFRLGFAPDSRNGLKEHLAQNGVNAQEMAEAGLVITGDDIAVPYDRFRDRVIFPITDFRARVIAFGGRAMSADVPAKYLNSPETPLFHKRLTLYNGQDARTAARAGKPIIVVEGYLDVITAVAAGFEGTVAPLGTALTEEHMQLLWRMTDSPILCFDGDDAGQRAAERSAELILPLLQPERTVRIATLPHGVDPDDLIRQHGRGAFADVLNRALPLSVSIWQIETRGVVPETPEARAGLEARLKARAQSIGDQSVRRHYLQAFDQRLAEFFTPPRSLRPEPRGLRRRGTHTAPAAGRTPQIMVSGMLRNSRLLRASAAGDPTPREAVIILTLLNHPQLAESRLELLADLDFPTPTARHIMGALIDAVTRDHDITGEALRAAIGARGFGDALQRMELLLAKQGIWQSGAEIAELDADTGLRHALALHNKKVQLNRDLKAAELALGDDPSEQNFERLRDIQNQITTVDGTEALIEGFGSLSGRGTRSF